jgi:hypothetical protein
MATSPGQMYENALNPSKGWPSQSALDHTAKISPNVLYDLKAGQTCHLNTVGQLEPGCVKAQMALWIFQGANDLDVNAAPGYSNSGTNLEWQPVSPTGRVACFVAKGSFELETTEFDSTLTYAPNDPLRAPTGNTATSYAAGSGKLTNAGVTLTSQTNTPATSSTAVCGLVSRGAFTNNFGRKVLAFWPVWYPGNATET